MKKIMGKFNKHLFPLLTALVLLIGLFPSLSASAAWDDPFDYTTLPYTVELGSDFNYVNYSYDSSHCMWTICTADEPNKIIYRALNTDTISWGGPPGEGYIVRCYPFGTNGLALDHIPNDTDIGFSASFDVETSDGSTDFAVIPSVNVYGWFKNGNNASSSREEFASFPLTNLSDPFSIVMPIDSEILFSKVTADSGAVYDRFIPMISLSGFVPSYSDYKPVEITFAPSNLVMKMPSSYWVQFQNEVLDSKLERTYEEFKAELESIHGDLDHFYQHWNTYFHNYQRWVFDAFDGVQNSIAASQTSINNNIDLSKVEILNAIADMNNSIVTGTPEMDNIAQDSNQNLSNSSDKLDSLGDQLASVTKPNVEDIEPSAPEQIVSDPNAGVILSGPITSLWDNPVIFGIVTTVLTLVLLSWVFFGKK